MGPPFVVEYNHNGKRYGTTVGGDSWREAEAHLKSIGSNGRIVGSDCITIKANSASLPFIHLYVVAITWLKNIWR